MLAKQKKQNSIIVSASKIFGVLLVLLWALSINAQAQTGQKKANLPILQEYKGIKIGMTAADVRAKLGKAQSDDKDGFLYVFGDEETAQILLDNEQKVKTVSVMYESGNLKAPKFEDIFGKEVAPEKQDGGAVYKMIKYADAGYWVSYNRAAGDKAMTILVMQKIQ
jgi:hypothetical protein